MLRVVMLCYIVLHCVTQDNDNRVREASHKALKACATAVKNGLAPHLRSIVGCWVSGMEDPHRPSASAAMAAFNAAFSEAKKTEVLEYSFSTVVKVIISRGSDWYLYMYLYRRTIRLHSSRVLAIGETQLATNYSYREFCTKYKNKL